jgi:uncharacterized protein (DUF433 family)
MRYNQVDRSARFLSMKHQRITTNPDVMTGKPVIVGTRIPVEQVLRELASGWSFAETLDAHPRLTLADIQAVLAYAADVVANEDVFLSVPANAVSG